MNKVSEDYILSCESTVDLPFSYVDGRKIPVLFYTYTVDGSEYTDDMGRDPAELEKFYGFIADGKIPKTAQLNVYNYLAFFRPLLEKGNVLHIAFGTGMTNSVVNAYEAAEILKGEFPERKLVVIDSYCSSSGYGLLVDLAADLRDEGKSLEETADWVRAHAKKIHHQFFTVDLQYFRRSGRMSGPAAAIATILNICPIMRLNNAGQIIAYGKVRGKKAAIAETVKMMAAHAEGGTAYSSKCFICNSNCLEDALALKEAVEAAFPALKDRVRICDIGAIIASHCGPGTVAVFFVGDERAV
ncbi:MAG: DegV family protein [Oscillospiraceae bacterium]|nr:DegV family protein [Oscillospiraceae bacterium]